MFEFFADGTRKEAEDGEFLRAYEKWAHEDEEGPALRKAALAAASDRWRDE